MTSEEIRNAPEPSIEQELADLKAEMEAEATRTLYGQPDYFKGLLAYAEAWDQAAEAAKRRVLTEREPTRFASCPNCGAEHDILDKLTGYRLWCVCRQWLVVEHRADGTTTLHLWGGVFFGEGPLGYRNGGQG
jgi:hypothetical protein